MQLQEGIGVCEQLMGIPIPLSYTRLTSRFLVLWHLTLPVILWDDCHWNVVPATFISAASLFCIEEVPNSFLLPRFSHTICFFLLASLSLFNFVLEIFAGGCSYRGAIFNASFRRAMCYGA